MNDSNRFHPSREQLKAFGLGLLRQSELSALESHIAECESCCESLSELADDTLLGLLHGNTVAIRPGPTVTSDAPSSDPQPELPAKLLDHPRYRLVRLLGSGGMGTVYEAEHRLMERRVALKLIKQSLIENPSAVERFRREVKAAARLTHPNIVTSYDAEETGGIHFLVMEYVDGVSLADVVRERGPLPVKEACAYAQQVALGLQHAHERGMVHRDIKPGNILLPKIATEEHRSTQMGNQEQPGMIRVHPCASVAKAIPKIADFGLARFVSEAAQIDSAEGLTSAQTIMGTPDFLAPEQAADAHAADIRADLYSLGCTLYFLLSGQVPFPGGGPLQKALAHRDRTPRSLTELRSDLPPALLPVLDRLLAKDPAKRFQTPAEAAEALAPFVDDSLPVFAPPPRKRGIWKGTAIACAIVAFVVVAGAIYRIQTDRGELVIDVKDEDVEVVVRKGGKFVKLIDTKTGQAVDLQSGEYDLELHGASDRLQLTTPKVTVRRGKVAVATIEHIATIEPEKIPVRLVLNDRQAAVFVDGNLIPPTKLAAPVAVMPGLHGVVAKRNGKAIVTRAFYVQRGDSPVINLQLPAEDPVSQWSGVPHLWLEVASNADQLGEESWCYLIEHPEGKLHGFWNEIEVQGKWVKAQVLELQGKDSGRNYQLQGTIENDVLTLNYASQKRNGGGKRKGQSALKRAPGDIQVWEGEYANDGYQTGSSLSVLATDRERNIRGVWDELPVAGKFLTPTTLELRGMGFDRSYIVQGTLDGDVLILKYQATILRSREQYYGQNTVRRVTPQP